MAEAVMGFSMPNSNLKHPTLLKTKKDAKLFPKTFLQQSSNGSNSVWMNSSSSVWFQNDEKRTERRGLWRAHAFPDWPLLAILVEHVEGQRDFIVHKSVFHLNDDAIKKVYAFYIMFTCWGCCVFGSTKDPHYDGEQYRKDGGDGTGFWVYEKQEDIEEAARSELWREELIEEIEQKVGGLRELEEAGKKEEELVR